MTVSFKCPNCKYLSELVIGSIYNGKTIKCEHCLFEYEIVLLQIQPEGITIVGTGAS